MAGFEFRKAARTSRRVRVAVDGPSGGGKTYSLLRLAFALKSAGLCRQIAVIDTENNSSELYAGEAPDGEAWDFDVLGLTSCSPTTYVQAMQAASKAGYDCIVIDSLSHAWFGKDGALDLVDRKGGQFGAWKDVTPLHRQLLDAILFSPSHVLASMRTKTEYVVEEVANKQGKLVKQPRKIGISPIQRDGLEYEFTLYGSLDIDHVLHISKSRCSAMQDANAFKPGYAFWQPLIDWLKAIPEPTPATATQTIAEPASPPTPEQPPQEQPAPAPTAAPTPAPGELITRQQCEILEGRLGGAFCAMELFLEAFEIVELEHLPAECFELAMQSLDQIGDIELLAEEKGVAYETILSHYKPAESLFQLTPGQRERVIRSLKNKQVEKAAS